MERPTRKQALERAVNSNDLILIGTGAATTVIGLAGVVRYGFSADSMVLPLVGEGIFLAGATHMYEEYRKIRNLINEEQELDKKLLKVAFFKGSKKEYEEQVGYEIQVIDSKQKDNVVVFTDNCNFYGKYNYINITQKEIPRMCDGNINFKEYLVNENIEAMVNCSIVSGGPSNSYERRHGIPITRKYVESKGV